MRVKCTDCKNFIEPVYKEPNNLFSKEIKTAKCKLEKRVLFQKPKTNNPFDVGGYYKYCNDFKQK